MPDATGVYTDRGVYDGRRYYQPAGEAYALWHDSSIPNWRISAALGAVGTLGWLSDTDVLTTIYPPYGTATGTVDVTLP